MSNPYRAPASSTRVETRPGIGSAILTAVMCFVVGYIATPILWLLAVPAPKSCPPPCDGPAMALAALLIVVGPVVGVISAFAGFLVRLHLMRRRLKSAS